MKTHVSMSVLVFDSTDTPLAGVVVRVVSEDCVNVLVHGDGHRPGRFAPLLERGTEDGRWCNVPDDVEQLIQLGAACAELRAELLTPPNSDDVAQPTRFSLSPYDAGSPDDAADTPNPSGNVPVVGKDPISAPAPAGETPTGAAPTGAAPTGAAPTGAAPTGAAPTGAAPTGAAGTPNPSGNVPVVGKDPMSASESADETPTGAAPTGAAPTGIPLSAYGFPRGGWRKE